MNKLFNKLLLINSFFVFFVFYAYSQNGNSNNKPVNNSQKILSINVEIGEEYYSKKLFFIRGDHKPQTVIWIEDEKGNYIDTLFITSSGAKGNWDAGVSGRPSCFPVWAHKRNIETLKDYFMPTKEKPMPDDVTQATPGKNFHVQWKIPDKFKDGNYKINLEVNTSFDYNDIYNNKNPKSKYYHEFDGQPSLIWSGIINIADAQPSFLLKIIGHGSLKGDSGTVDSDLKDFSTALNLIKSVEIKVIK